MATFSFYLVMIATVTCCAPSTPRYVVTWDLHSAVNNTLCPFMVHKDVDKDRLPEVITHIRCLETEISKSCEARGLSQHQCCTDELQCVQLSDVVWVQYGPAAAAEPLPVDAGCACAPTHAAAAHQPEGPPPS